MSQYQLALIDTASVQIVKDISQHTQNNLMSYAKALKKAQCESVETTIRKRRFLSAGAVQRMTNERLPHRVMFGTLAGGDRPGPGLPKNNWAQCRL